MQEILTGFIKFIAEILPDINFKNPIKTIIISFLILGVVILILLYLTKDFN